MYNNDNPDLPTLNAWKLVTAPPAQRFVFERNPYYYRIDEKGMQLPYLDRVIFTVAATNLIPAKAGLGEADLQPRYLDLRDYTFLRKMPRRTRASRCCCGRRARARELAFYPNLNANDETWRKLNARRPLPPRPVAGDRPRRAERGRLYRPGDAVEQHDHAALGAVQARVREQMGEPRCQDGRQAARRDRPRPSAATTASACCPTASPRSS